MFTCPYMICFVSVTIILYALTSTLLKQHICVSLDIFALIILLPCVRSHLTVEYFAMSRNLLFRGSVQPCEYCGELKPQRTDRLLISCCRLPGCKERLCSLCCDCVFNLFECYEMSERPPHDNEAFHIWLFHHISCRNECSSE